MLILLEGSVCYMCKSPNVKIGDNGLPACLDCGCSPCRTDPPPASFDAPIATASTATEKGLPPHEFNSEHYCKHCGIGMAFQQRPGEPCPALSTPKELAETAWLEMEAPETKISVEPGRVFVRESVAIKPGWATVNIAESSPQVWLAVQTAYGSPGQSNDEPSSMEIIGIYENEALAIAACKSATDCIGPWSLNFTAPREQTPWPGAYYPLAVPPVVIGNLDNIAELPVGCVTIGEHGEAYWHQAGVAPEENAIPGECPECGSGPVEGQVGMYLLPRGWPYASLCKTCERRTRQLFFNIGYASSRRRVEELAAMIEEGRATPPGEQAVVVEANTPKVDVFVKDQQRDDGDDGGYVVKSEDIITETLPVAFLAPKDGPPGLILGPPSG